MSQAQWDAVLDELARRSSGARPSGPDPRQASITAQIDQRIARQETGWTSDGMAVPAVFAAVRLLASSIDQLRLTVPAGSPSGWLDDPRTMGSVFDQGDLVQWIVTHMALRGRAWLLATRTAGFSWRLDPLDPDQVHMRTTVGEYGRIGVECYAAGSPLPLIPPYREWRTTAGEKATNWDLAGNRFLVHIPYVIAPGHPEGVGPLQVARNAITGYERVERQAADLLENGTYSGGRLETDQDITADTAERYQERWVENRKLGRLPVLGSGLRYVNDILSPVDAQWLESRQFNSSQVAQMYGIPPDYLGMALAGNASSLSYSNSADNDRRFRRNALEGFTTQIGDALSTLLPGRGDRVQWDWTGWEGATPAADDGSTDDAQG